jgi:CRP-like cAMP-binding protein
MVRKAPLFSGLDDEAAADLEESMRRVDLKRGQVLFHEGDQSDRMYVIAEGKIKIGRAAPDGRSTLLKLLGPGEEFGELSLFDPDCRSGTATAVTEARLYALSNHDLRPWLESRPEVALALLRQLSNRMRQSREVVADLVFSDVPARVAKTLLELSTRFGTPKDEGVHVWHDLTQEELAQLVGASRETVNKALADFGNRGWLRLEPRAVVLLDMDRLKQRSH